MGQDEQVVFQKLIQLIITCVLSRTFTVERYNTKKKPVRGCSNNRDQERCLETFKHPPYVTSNLWGWWAF